MRRYINACQVRNELLVSMGVSLEYQDALSKVQITSKTLRAHEQAELKGHVESGKPVGEFDPTQVVYPVVAHLDQPDDVVEPHVANDFESGARDEFTGNDGEDQRPEETLVSRIERAVDKDLV
jgi:hypothetical protein